MSRGENRGVLCSSCRRLVDKEAKTCPHCGARNPNLSGLAGRLRDLWKEDLLQAITMVCMAVYVLHVGLTMIVAPEYLTRPRGWLAIGAPHPFVSSLAGATSGAQLWGGHLWTLVSASFVHYSVLHIGFNLYWLQDLGRMAREIFGPARFIVVFGLSGIGGFLLSDVVSGAPTAGASCALFGLLGAMATFGWRRGGVDGERIKAKMIRWTIIATIFAVAMGGVNHLGHGGGLLTGVALAFTFPSHEGQRESRAVQLLAVGLLVLWVVCLLGAAVGWFILSPQALPYLSRS